MADVKRNLLINGANSISVGGSGTAIKYFPFVPGSSIGVSSLKNGYVWIPGNNESNGQRLGVRASGYFQIGGPIPSPVVTLALYPVTLSTAFPNMGQPQNALASSATVGSTAIVSGSTTGSSGEQAFGTNYPWALDAQIVADGSSGLAQLLSGQVILDGNNTPASAGLISGLSGLVMSNPVPFGLVVGVTFSVSNTANSASMLQFDLSI